MNKFLQQEFLQKVCLKCFSEKKFFSQVSNFLISLEKLIIHEMS